MPSWLFLGDAYGRALGLPAASLLQRVMGRIHATFLGAVLFLYVRVFCKSKVLKALTFEMPMRFIFRRIVSIILKEQPRCRFAQGVARPSGAMRALTTCPVGSKAKKEQILHNAVDEKIKSFVQNQHLIDAEVVSGKKPLP